MQLHQYQINASNALLERTKSILSSDQQLTDVYLKAITGAGKTVIMSNYMKEVIDYYEGHKRVAFVWMSIGTGGLHQQSYRALRSDLPVDIKLYDSYDFQSITALDHKDVLVLNWETVNRMQIDQGDVTFDNVSMRDGERISLPQLFEQTRNQGTKIIMIIDEAHIGAETPSTEDQLRTRIIKRDVIKPKMIVNVTATPKFAEEIPSRNIIQVDTEAVIREGRIKREVRIDDSMDISEDNEFVASVLRSAITKQEYLKELYQSEGNDHINPLCLVQIPNGKLGEEMKAFAEEVLAERGYTYDRGNLAEVVDRNINMQHVKDSDSPVSFLINKQAISTGWDAPRAQIWVKLRDTKSAVFDAQTLGRILRMPAGEKVDDRTHPNYNFFEHDELNYAYVYTDVNYSISTSEYKAIFPTQKRLKDELKEDVQSLVFKKQTVSKNPISVADIKVRRALQELIRDGFDTSERDFSHLSVTVSAGSYAIYDLEDDGTEVETQTFALLHKKDIERVTNEFIKKTCGSAINPEIVFSTIMMALSSHYELGNDFSIVRQWILANRETISQVLDQLKREASQISSVEARIELEDFTFPESVLINEKVDGDLFEKCAYTKEPTSEYGTEKAFEEVIDEHENVKWWIKNMDSGKDGLSIAYTDENRQLRPFYPDYIVRFNDGSLGVYETKSLPDLKEANTTAKERALHPYLQQARREMDLPDIYGGIVYLEKKPISGRYAIKEGNVNHYPELIE